MVATTYNYPKAGFPGGVLHPGKLHRDIFAAIPSPPNPALLGVSTDGQVSIDFEDALDAATKAVLDGVIAAHPGYDVVLKFHASSTVLPQTLLIGAVAPAWDKIGELFTSPYFFVANLAAAKGRAVGQAKTNGAGAVIRIVEQDAAGVDVVVGSFNVPNTAGAWQPAKFFTNVVPRAGDLNYRLEAQAPAGVVLEVRAFSLSLIEFVIVPGA